MTDTVHTSTGARPRRLPPEAPGHWLWGNLPAIQRDGLGYYMRSAMEHGDVVRMRVGPYGMVMLNHPDHIRHVLQDNNHNYDKNNFGNNLLRPVVGNGLLLSEGDFWRRQRRLMQPMFHRQRIAALGRTMTGCAAETLAAWEARLAAGRPFDMADDMMRLTLSIVSRSLFTRESGGDAEVVGRAATEVVEYLGWRFVAYWAPPETWPTPRNRRFQRARRALDDVVYRLIRDRRERPVEADDLLNLLLEARDETGQGMSDSQLRDEVMTLYLAGHETTAITLAWTWYLLSTHPAAGRRLRAELKTVLDGRLPTIDDLPSLSYTRMVIDEAMRLYPPAWAISRRAIQADEIGGCHIPANSFVFFCPYVMHRHPAYWPNPEGFDPERFAPEHESERPRYVYFPFGGGPRQCIGNLFALVESQLILATLAQRFRPELVPGHPVEPAPLVTLRPRGGITMTLRAAAD